MKNYNIISAQEMRNKLVSINREKAYDEIIKDLNQRITSSKSKYISLHKNVFKSKLYDITDEKIIEILEIFKKKGFFYEFDHYNIIHIHWNFKTEKEFDDYIAKKYKQINRSNYITLFSLISFVIFAIVMVLVF